MTKQKIIIGDCNDVLPTLKDNNFDLLYTNPPFGITNADWDVGLDWQNLWPIIWKKLKPNGAVILHSSMPFTFDLVASQRKYFKYNYVWIKNTHTGFFQRNSNHLEDTKMFVYSIKNNQPIILK